ncbi:MAG: ankyrin repeat domain-containing protein [Anaerolineae bacterium]|nr:ankyrin repeat domain-containing protein [Anaerolineae bacterium]MCO5197169.1 ankyrin repeat domain-containing protein [Anaerolineae bacterium]
MSDRPDPISAEIVNKFVIAAHGNLDLVRSMLVEQPPLANATWDWGGGDFESALGAAAHTGSRAIANLLLAGGARFDLPCAVMLGQVDVVRAVLNDNPALVKTPGAHGIPLRTHAQIGGNDEMLALIDFFLAQTA